MSAVQKTVYILLLCCSFTVQSEPVQGSWPGGADANDVSITASAERVTEGFITLEFQGLPAAEPFQLQVSTDPRFEKLLHNLKLVAQSQVHLSGFDDGDYFARVISPSGQPSASTAQFSVAHRDLNTATGLFGLGAVLFVLLVACLIRFTQNNN